MTLKVKILQKNHSNKRIFKRNISQYTLSLKVLYNQYQFLYINIKVKMREVQKSVKNQRKLPKTKKIRILPFIVQKPPLQNAIAYEKKGHWSQKQKLKYVFFLRYFKDKFTGRSNKRFCRIFKVMSDFIKTRTHNQCRSHHQKMEVERNQVDSIINNVASKYHPRNYQLQYQKYQVEMAYLNIQELQEYQNKSKNDRFSVQQSSNQIFKQNQSPKQSNSKVEQPHDLKVQQKMINQEFNQFIVKQEENIEQPIAPLIQLKRPNITQIFPQLNFNYTDKRHEFMPHVKEQKQQQKPTDDTPRQSQQEYDQRDQGYDYAKIYSQKLRQKKQNKIKEKNQKRNNQREKDFKKRTREPDFKSLDPQTYQDNIYLSRRAAQMNNSFDLNVEALETHRLNCLNKATSHYNQMQLELRSVAQCQKEKQQILGLDMGIGSNPFQFPTSNQPQFEFRSFNKNF